MDERLIAPELALGHEYPTQTSSYDEQTLALYALGVGAAEDPLDPLELRYVYPQSPAGFLPLPTYGVVAPINALMVLNRPENRAPGLRYGLDRVLHGEQSMTLARPLPSRQALTHHAKIVGLFDKGSDGGKKGGALVVTKIDTRDEAGETLVVTENVTYVRGAGGWGGDRGSSLPGNEPPARPADRVAEQRIPPNQALLYRLSGDWNPLHADPEFAMRSGFSKPILHGLATLGFAVRHVLGALSPEGDPSRMQGFRVRFSDVVFPGETLRTEMWKEGARALFRVSVLERQKVVLSNGSVDFFG
jgi:(3R)-3-hydroxyacyl-CoA dehydrogenase / 3a,7a,12a-trihydroxy-5b-cholest-24-enoyl-CoA hydratase / enoyl-CoA hydratase 2